MYLGVQHIYPVGPTGRTIYLNPKDISNQTIKGEEEHHDTETGQASPDFMH